MRPTWASPSSGRKNAIAFAQVPFNSRRLKRAVAQLGRALEWGSRGRGFESRRPDFGKSIACVLSKK